MAMHQNDTMDAMPDLMAVDLTELDPPQDPAEANEWEGSYENEHVLGMDGNDTLSGDPEGVAPAGLESHDFINGNKGDDSIEGGVGDDTLHGGQGDDEVRGGVGDDKVYGDKGDDTIAGDAGDDMLRGGEGADSLLGDEGNDTLYGGMGNDVLDGGMGNDMLSGDMGIDILYGGEGDDVLMGGDSQIKDTSTDYLYGQAGNDHMNGNKGDDFLYGGDGADTVRGGKDDDHIEGGYEEFPDAAVFAQAGVSHSLVDMLHGDKGNDTIFAGQVDETATDTNLKHVDEVAKKTITVDVPDREEDIDVVLMRGNMLYGGEGDDHLYGAQGADTLMGNDGNDMLVDGGGVDHLDGGQGDDMLYAAHVYDGAGADPASVDTDYDGGNMLMGGAGDDVLTGVVRANDGTVAGNSGMADVLDAGEGIDRLVAVGLIDNTDIANTDIVWDKTVAGLVMKAGGGGADVFDLSATGLTTAGNSVIEIHGLDADIDKVKIGALLTAGVIKTDGLVDDAGTTDPAFDGSIGQVYDGKGYALVAVKANVVVKLVGSQFDFDYLQAHQGAAFDELFIV